MSTFAELLVDPRGRLPGEMQADAARDFACRVRQSRLHPRCPDESIPGGTFVVLGVASYSPDELDLLDEIDARHDLRPANVARVDVFNVLDCQSHADFRRFLPGLQVDVWQTPVVGIWIDGHLQSVATGLAATRQSLQNLGVL